MLRLDSLSSALRLLSVAVYSPTLMPMSPKHSTHFFVLSHVTMYSSSDQSLSQPRAHQRLGWLVRNRLASPLHRVRYASACLSSSSQHHNRKVRTQGQGDVTLTVTQAAAYN
jgi:hypothetical protein